MAEKRKEPERHSKRVSYEKEAEKKTSEMLKSFEHVAKGALISVKQANDKVAALQESNGFKAAIMQTVGPIMESVQRRAESILQALSAFRGDPQALFLISWMVQGMGSDARRLLCFIEYPVGSIDF